MDMQLGDGMVTPSGSIETNLEVPELPPEVGMQSKIDLEKR